MIRLSIRYCGGCNAAYDRQRLVEEILRRLRLATAEEVSLVPRGEAADATLVVCGCPACCADAGERPDDPSPCHVLGPDLTDYLPAEMEGIPRSVAERLARELRRTGV